MALDPVSMTLGAIALAVAAASYYAAYLRGARTAREPDHVVDMQEVANYHRYTSSNRALRQDVADDETP